MGRISFLTSQARKGLLMVCLMPETYSSSKIIAGEKNLSCMSLLCTMCLVSEHQVSPTHDIYLRFDNTLSGKFCPSACGALAGASCPSQNLPACSHFRLRFPPEFGDIAGCGQALFQRNFHLRIHAEDGSWKRNFEAFSKRHVSKAAVE